MASLLHRYLASIRKEFDAWNGQGVAQLVALSEVDFVALQNELKKDAGTQRVTRQYFNGSSSDSRESAFLRFITTLLDYNKKAQPYVEEDTEQVTKAEQNWEKVYLAATSLFTTTDSAWFVPVMRVLASELVRLALKADKVDQAVGRRFDDEPLHPTATRAVMVLIRPFSIASNDQSQTRPSKRELTLFLATKALQLFFRIGQIQTAETVIKTATRIRDLDREAVATAGLAPGPAADRVMFAYWLARMLLLHWDIRGAEEEFRNAFNETSNRDFKIKRQFLIYLVACSISLGNYPTEVLLRAFDLYDQYGGLVRNLRLGNAWACFQALERHSSFFEKKGLLDLLEEKVEIQCWRNLIRRTLFIQRQITPHFFPNDIPFRLPLTSIVITARVAFRDNFIDIYTVESVLISLLSKGFIEGNIYMEDDIEQSFLVVWPEPPFGFPRIAEVHQVARVEPPE